jgi:hypothetical protein
MDTFVRVPLGCFSTEAPARRRPLVRLNGADRRACQSPRPTDGGAAWSSTATAQWTAGIPWHERDVDVWRLHETAHPTGLGSIFGTTPALALARAVAARSDVAAGEAACTGRSHDEWSFGFNAAGGIKLDEPRGTSPVFAHITSRRHPPAPRSTEPSRSSSKDRVPRLCSMRPRGHTAQIAACVRTVRHTLSACQTAQDLGTRGVKQ